MLKDAVSNPIYSVAATHQVMSSKQNKCGLSIGKNRMHRLTKHSATYEIWELTAHNKEELKTMLIMRIKENKNVNYREEERNKT